MKIVETITNLKAINKMLEIEKEYSGAIVDCGRLLIDEDSLHEVKALAERAGSLIATIESNYGSYGRMTPFSKKFAVIKK